VARLAVDIEVAHGKAVLQQSVRREADRLRPRGLHVPGAGLLADEVADGHGIVGRPSIPHCDRQVKEVARVHGRFGDIRADRFEQSLIPEPCDAGLGVRRVCGGDGPSHNGDHSD
jgi:hypothetical protein